MGSEQVLKKSLLGGFKKEGVLNYIEQLQSEILTLKKEVNENSDCKNQLESILEERDNTDNGFAALKEENEQLKAVIEALNEEKAMLSAENEELKKELEKSGAVVSEFEAKQAKWEEKIAVIEEKFAEIELSYSRMGENDNRVNGMLNDAKVYSDKIIADAKASASDISAKTAAAVENAKAEIISANDRIQTACVNFTSSAESLKTGTENLLKILSDISDNMNKSISEEE